MIYVKAGQWVGQPLTHREKHIVPTESLEQRQPLTSLLRRNKVGPKGQILQDDYQRRIRLFFHDI